MKITWFGHASVRIVTSKGTIIYVDPYAGEESWYDKIADAVLITHGHYDHLKDALLPLMMGDETLMLAPPPVAKLHNGCRPVLAGQTGKVKDAQVSTVHAYTVEHPNHPREEGVGYIITADGKSVYVAGDTDVIPEMRQLKADVVLLPVGGTYTMDAKQAAEVVAGMRPKLAIPYHYGLTVGTADDAELFRESCEAEEVACRILKFDEEIEV